MMPKKHDKVAKLEKYEKELIEDIKSKKELRTLDNDFVNKKIEDFLRDHRDYQYKAVVLEKLNNAKTYKQFSKSKECDFLIKSVRAELRKVYGVFVLDGYSDRDKLLKDCDIDDDFSVSETHRTLLQLHKSTKERFENYPEIYENIFSFVDSYIEKQELTIMDLGCGMNPLSSVFFRDRIAKYIASDISAEDCEFLKRYFEKMKIDGKTFVMDLTDEKNIVKLEKEKADVCFIFKTLDGLERVNRGISEKLLKALDVDIIVVSFSTLSIGGRNIISTTRRFWFEEFLNKTGWEYEKFEYPAELFYIMRKQ